MFRDNESHWYEQTLMIPSHSTKTIFTLLMMTDTAKETLILSSFLNFQREGNIKYFKNHFYQHVVRAFFVVFCFCLFCLLVSSFSSYWGRLCLLCKVYTEIPNRGTITYLHLVGTVKQPCYRPCPPRVYALKQLNTLENSSAQAALF